MKLSLLRFLKYILIIGLGLFLLSLIPVLTQAANLRRYFHSMQSGKANVEIAINDLKSQDYKRMQSKASEAAQDFTDAGNTLSRIKENKLAHNLSPLAFSLNDLEYLTKTSEILSRSLFRSGVIIDEINTVTSGRLKNSFSSLSDQDRQKVLAIVYQSAPELNGLKANLQLSLDNLDKINRIGILMPFNSKLTEIKEQIKTAKGILDELVPLIHLLPALSGYPEESNFVVILQNNDELRPTGGFIGTYGLMTVKDAKPAKIITEDVYHLDMPCIGKLTLEPPYPVKKYMNVTYWWLRDANWSPDFPTSAKQIQSMFIAENSCTGKTVNPPTGIIAINPDLIADLLRLAGPITVDGQVYDSSNFQPLLQYNVEMAYKEKDISSWDRKDIINSVVDELENRLTNLPSDKWPQLLKILQENIAKRNIQIYFNNSDWQGIAKSIGIAGEIKDSGSDYLNVIDSNLAAFKSDAVMEKKISYTVSETKDGLKAKLILDYRHTGGFDWRTTRYRSYTRIYAPLGSRILNPEGLTDFSATDDRSLDKSVFGFFWSIEPGQEKTVSLDYFLPKNIQADNYSLYFQKQSGSRLKEFNYDKYFLGEKSYHWTGAPDRDQSFY